MQPPKSWLLLFLLTSCALPKVAPPPPPQPLFSRIAPPGKTISPLHPLPLPPFVMPVGWQTNHWRVARSTNMVDWEGVCAWSQGKPVEIYLPQGQGQYFLRLESWSPPPYPYWRKIDPTNGD
jgi:hypothetical protein